MTTKEDEPRTLAEHAAELRRALDSPALKCPPTHVQAMLCRMCLAIAERVEALEQPNDPVEDIAKAAEMAARTGPTSPSWELRDGMLLAARGYGDLLTLHAEADGLWSVEFCGKKDEPQPERLIRSLYAPAKRDWSKGEDDLAGVARMVEEQTLDLPDFRVPPLGVAAGDSAADANTVIARLHAHLDKAASERSRLVNENAKLRAERDEARAKACEHFDLMLGPAGGCRKERCVCAPDDQREDCPVHGRTIDEVIEDRSALSTRLADALRERDRAREDLEKLRAVLVKGEPLSAHHCNRCGAIYLLTPRDTIMECECGCEFHPVSRLVTPGRLKLGDGDVAAVRGVESRAGLLDSKAGQ